MRYFLAAGALALACTLAPSAVRRAEACATFGPVREPKSAPSPELERVLIVHDPVARVQHFIREVVFAGNAKSFGFVVPIPTKPEVFAVSDAPFDRLEQAFPFAPRPAERSAQPASRARSATLSDSMAAVEVIERKAVGSFTSFVLRASDPRALATWLRENQLGSTAQNDAWLAGYVARDYYYVAMRYEPSQHAASGKLDSETVRISFEAPVAYYPYAEPASAGRMKLSRRALAIWLVAPEQLVPVALEQRTGGSRWLQPFQPGERADGIKGQRVRVHLGGAEARFIDPEASLVVHTFEDQKRERDGLGDVVWLPARGVAPAARAEVGAFVARALGSGADSNKLLEDASALRSLPLRATQAGVRFDPTLRAKFAPKRQMPRYTLGDDF